MSSAELSAAKASRPGKARTRCYSNRFSSPRHSQSRRRFENLGGKLWRLVTGGDGPRASLIQYHSKATKEKRLYTVLLHAHGPRRMKSFRTGSCSLHGRVGSPSADDLWIGGLKQRPTVCVSDRRLQCGIARRTAAMQSSSSPTYRAKKISRARSIAQSDSLRLRRLDYPRHHDHVLRACITDRPRKPRRADHGLLVTEPDLQRRWRPNSPQAGRQKARELLALRPA